MKSLAERKEQADYILDLKMDPTLWRPDISREEALAFFDKAREAASRQADYPAILEFKKRKSMLHPDTMIMMRALASVVQGPIVEFGTYMGGSTVMIAKGAGDNARFLAVEPGGSYPDHPHLPSADIFADMQQTLKEQDVTHRVELVQGFSNSPQAIEGIKRLIGDDKIAMLVIDSDGNVKRDIEIYEPLCAKGCVLVIDDYVDTGRDAYRKSDTVNACVDARVEAGDFIPFDVLRWGTWFGRLK